MFTGLIQERGRLLTPLSGGRPGEITVEAREVIREARRGDSIAVNGVCLTVTELLPRGFRADVMAETLRCTRLGSLRPGAPLNLEKSLTPSSLLGGHLVYGDVDTLARIQSVTPGAGGGAGGRVYRFSLPPEWMRYIAAKGRVAVDGASLTVAARDDRGFSVSLIPHSAKHLILGDMGPGDEVHIEIDPLARYCETLLKGGRASAPEEPVLSTLTWEKLRSYG